MSHRLHAAALLLAAAAIALTTVSGTASSHREAPLISQDPLADNTDVYAFVSPNRPDRVTLIANFIPLEAPYGGPNFFKFDDNVLYEIMVDNDGDAVEDVTFQFRFRTQIAVGRTFLYNVGPITSLTSSNWNRRQTYTVTRIDWKGSGQRTILASGVPCPPCVPEMTPLAERPRGGARWTAATPTSSGPSCAPTSGRAAGPGSSRSSR